MITILFLSRVPSETFSLTHNAISSLQEHKEPYMLLDILSNGMIGVRAEDMFFHPTK